MNLRSLQIILWVAAIAAFAAFEWSRWPAANDAAAEAQSGFKPSFSLTDDEGIRRRAEDFRGKFLLVFFGYTNCPDVCPTTMAEVAQVMDDLGQLADKVQPVFVSIDPERDRKQGLKAYTQAFHPSILGLAGTDSETQAAAASFKVFYDREADPAASGGYTMSHSTGLSLLGPDGEWLKQFPYGTSAPDILTDLKSRF